MLVGWMKILAEFAVKPSRFPRALYGTTRTFRAEKMRRFTERANPRKCREEILDGCEVANVGETNKQKCRKLQNTHSHSKKNARVIKDI